MSRLHDSTSDLLALASDAPALGAGAITEPDPLSDVLRTVRLTGALFFVWDVSWPYTTPVPDGRVFAPIVLPGAQQIISYHIITHGSCWCSVNGEPALELQTGDILLVPHGDAYVMSNAPGTCRAAGGADDQTLAFFRKMADGALPFVVRDGGGGPGATRMVCGFLGCDVQPFNPMLAALPRLVRLRAGDESRHGRLRTLIEYTLAEARVPRPGTRSVLVRLSELLFVEVVRRCLTELPAAQGGWLAGLRDPLVGRALMLLHREPTRAWTLEMLAAAVGISRSRLAECFTQLVDQPPMQYLAHWRMQLAARLLADGSAKVASVAREVGYSSEAAFSRAFKRCTGVAPAQWRLQQTVRASAAT